MLGIISLYDKLILLFMLILFVSFSWRLALVIIFYGT